MPLSALRQSAKGQLIVRSKANCPDTEVNLQESYCQMETMTRVSQKQGFTEDFSSNRKLKQISTEDKSFKISKAPIN